MPEGPLGGPRPAAESTLSVAITLESFHVSEEDMETLTQNRQKEMEFQSMFEEQFGVPVKNITYTKDGARGIEIETGTDSWMVFSRGESDINTIVNWLKKEIGPVSSVQMRCE